tara:strand:- start:11169 stop:12854 length:1686 start_codon:yes stop_codon:yes gene_type:complete
MWRAFLLAVALGWPTPALAQGHVAQAVETVRAQARADLQAFADEWERSEYGEALERLGALDDPPPIPTLLAQIERELGGEYAAYRESDADDPGALTGLLGVVLPSYLPLLREPGRARWLDIYWSAAQAGESWSPWGEHPDIQTFLFDLRAAGLAFEADVLQARYEAQLADVALADDPQEAFEGAIWQADTWSALQRPAQAMALRRTAFASLRGAPDLHPEEPILDYHRAWSPEETALAAEILARLSERQWRAAFGYIDGEPGLILAARLDVAAGTSELAQSLELLEPHWGNDRDRARARFLRVVIGDALARDDRAHATGWLRDYQRELVDQANGHSFELVHAWADLGDCERVTAAAQILRASLSTPYQAWRVLENGDDDADWEAGSALVHADLNWSIALNRPHGLLARGAARLIECGEVSRAAWFQTGRWPSERTVEELSFEIALSALYQTLSQPEYRAALDRESWQRWPQPRYDFEAALLPLLPLRSGSQFRPSQRAAGVSTLTMMLRGMPGDARGVWEPVYLAAAYEAAQAMGDGDERLRALAQLAGAMEHQPSAIVQD